MLRVATWSWSSAPGPAPVGDRQGERERGSATLVGDRPRSARRGPRSRAGQSPGRGPSRRPGPGPGRPCRSARRRAPASRAGCRSRGPRPTRPRPGRRPRPATPRPSGPIDLASVGAELHRVVDQVDDHLAEPFLGAAHRGHALGRDIDAEADALPFGEQAQPVGRGASQPAQVDLVEQEHRPAATRSGPGRAAR